MRNQSRALSVLLREVIAPSFDEGLAALLFRTLLADDSIEPEPFVKTVRKVFRPESDLTYMESLRQLARRLAYAAAVSCKLQDADPPEVLLRASKRQVERIRARLREVKAKRYLVFCQEYVGCLDAFVAFVESFHHLSGHNALRPGMGAVWVEDAVIAAACDSFLFQLLAATFSDYKDGAHANFVLRFVHNVVEDGTRYTWFPQEGASALQLELHQKIRTAAPWQLQGYVSKLNIPPDEHGFADALVDNPYFEEAARSLTSHLAVTLGYCR